MITTASGSPPQTHYLKHMRSVKRQRDKKKLQKKDARLSKKQQTPGSPDRSRWKKSSHLTPKRALQREIDLSSLQLSKLSLDDGASGSGSDCQPLSPTSPKTLSAMNGHAAVAESPMLTPRLARSRSSQHRTESADSVAKALFNTLFAGRRKGPQKALFKDWDEPDDEEDEDVVDEAWITNFLKDSVVATKAIDYALQHSSGTELLNGLVDEAFVYKIVNDLRFEDHRVSSARLSIIKAIFRSCPNLRICVAEALVNAADQRLQRSQYVDAVAEELELDSDDVALTEFHPRANYRRKIPPNAKAPIAVRDHGHLLIELIQFLLDELSNPTSAFYSTIGQEPPTPQASNGKTQQSSNPLSTPSTTRLAHRAPATHSPATEPPNTNGGAAVARSPEEPAPFAGRQRARSETLGDEDLCAIRRRSRANTVVECKPSDRAAARTTAATATAAANAEQTGDQSKRTRPASTSHSPTRADGPSKHRRRVEADDDPPRQTPARGNGLAAPSSQDGQPSLRTYDNIVKTWRACVWAMHQAIISMVRTHGCRVGNPNGPDSGEINELDGCIRRLLGLAPYIGPYLCRGLLQSWPTGIASREVAFIRLLETILSTVPCILSKEVLAAHAASMGLPTASTNNLPVKAATRCIWKVGACLNNKHFRVSQQAIACVRHPVIIAQVLVPNRHLLERISNALRENRNHWHPVVREQSDLAFDALLDFL